MRISCCYKCEKRELGCHSECVTYIAQVERIREENRLERIRSADWGSYMSRVHKAKVKGKR